MTSRVSPALFNFIDEAQDDLRAVTALARPLLATSAIRQFYINFYAQFFENVLKSDIDTLSQRDALRAGVLLKRKSGLSTEVRALVRRFQKLCKMDPDLRGGDYGGGTSFYRSFHEDFVPDLLSDIAAWADSEAEADVAERASASLRAYRRTLEEVTREPGSSRLRR